MADDAKKNSAQSPAEAAEPTPAPKSSLVKYLVFGLVGLIAVIGVAFGTLMLVGSEASEPSTVEVAEKSGSEAHGTTSSETDGSDAQGEEAEMDSILALLEQDDSVLDEVLANLEALDYVPTEEELTDTEGDSAAKDSIEAADWIKAEKSRLAEWDKELTVREKKLTARETKVQAQIARIEQAESARIAKLAKLYDGMDPSAVARLLSNLDDDTVVALLPRMKLKNASEVLALMPPARAAKLSKQMITIAEN